MSAYAEPQPEKAFQPRPRLQEALFSLLTLEKGTRGAQIPQLFFHCPKFHSWLTDNPALGHSGGIPSAHHTQVFK